MLFGVDRTIVYYSGLLAASFGISHIDLIHNNLTRFFPRTYPYMNVALPCGRAVGILGIFVRSVEILEASNEARRPGASSTSSAS